MTRQGDARWQGHPLASRILRAIAMLLPIVLAIGTAWFVGKQLPPPESLAEAVLAWVMLSALSTVVLVIVDRFARRLLPLAALLKLSLAFPERAPSRYKLARASGSTRQLAEEVEHAREHGLSSDRTQAAESVLRLVAALSTHDSATRGHAERVRVFTDMIATELELDEEDIDKLRWASLLHDVGKIAVHPEVLNKPGQPSEAEWELLRQHPLEGARIIAPLREWLGPWALAVEQHHERWDGAGYPHGLAGEEISLGARIVCVADAFDVMTAARAYKEAMSSEAAREELARHAGSQFDPMVVRAFLGIAVGRLRWAVGPLSWLANTPLARPVPTVQGLTTILSGAAATAVGVAAYGVVPDLPAAEVPELEPIAEAVVETPVPELPALPEPEPQPEPEVEPEPEQVLAEPPTPPPPAEPDIVVPPARTNSAPVAATDDVVLDEDLEVVIDVLANDTDLDGDRLFLASVDSDFGEVAIEPDGRIRFRPPADWSGTATVTYVASDGVAQASGTVNINVRPANDAPVLAADRATVLEDGAVTVDLLANDRDIDGDTLRVVGVTGSTLGGTAVVNPDGTVTYRPGRDRNGVDVLTYTVTDGTTTVTGRFEVLVTAVNDAPVATERTVTSPEDTQLVLNVRESTTDVDGDDLVVTGAAVSAGTLEILPSGNLRVTPPADFNGTLVVTYVISDGVAVTPGVVRLIISPKQDAPVAGSDALTVPEDSSAASVDLLANDTDVDGDALSVTAINATGVTLGTVTRSGGVLTFTPAPDRHGTETLTYTVSDGVRTDKGTVTITVTPVNDAPVLGPEGATTLEDASVDTDVLVNDTDVDGDTLMVVSPAASVGTATIVGGRIRFSPPADWNGNAVVDYGVSDGTVTVPATLAIQVLPVNDEPTFTVGDTVLVDEDAGLVEIAGWATDISAGAADEEPPAQTLTFTVVVGDTGLFSTQPTIDASSGDLSFVTAPGMSGSTDISVELSDDGGTANGGDDRSSDSAIITIDSVDDPPVAVDDDATIDEDTSVTLDVLANDSDPEFVALTITAIDTSTLTFGAAVDNGDGTITYTPDPDQNGIDTMTYTVSDGVNEVDATVTFTVDPVQDAPVAVADALDVDEDGGPTDVDVLGNDTDADGDVLSVISIDTTGLTLGSATLAGGTVTYTPDPDANGTDTVTYELSDGVDTVTGTLTITVVSINDAPVPDDESVTIDEDTSTTIDLLDGDVDVDGDALTVVALDTSGLAVGSVVNNGDGTVTYTPEAEANGIDVFTYTVSDGTDTATATVTVTVTPQPDAPVAVDDAYVTPLSGILIVSSPALGLLNNDDDADGDAFQVDTVSQPPLGQGSVLPFTNGTFTYTAGLFSGTTTFSYTIRDATGRTSAPATVTIVVPTSASAEERLYLGSTLIGAATNGMSPTPPANTGGPIPDLDGDADIDPGLTIDNSDGRLDEDDPLKYHNWDYVVPGGSPLVLAGPVSLDLWSAVQDLEGDEAVDYTIAVYECPAGGGPCVVLASRIDVHRNNWNPEGAYRRWVLSVGTVDETIEPGNTLRVRLQFGHKPVWLPLTGELPTSLTYNTPA